jgi:hypothetical protein
MLIKAWIKLICSNHRYRKAQNILLKFCYVPATSAAHNRLLFFLFLLQPFTVLMKQTRQAVRAIKQSIFLDVYGSNEIMYTFSLLFIKSFFTWPKPLYDNIAVAKCQSFYILNRLGQVCSTVVRTQTHTHAHT